MSDDEPILDEARLQVQSCLAEGWAAEVVGGGESSTLLVIKDHSGSNAARFLIVAQDDLTPKKVKDLLANPAVRALRDFNRSDRLVVIAPYLSARTQAVLRDANVSYADSGGNMWLVSGGVHIDRQGSKRNSKRSEYASAGTSLRGAKRGLAIRMAVSIKPPFTVTELADASGLDLPYVSQIISGLEEQSYLERTPRGPIQEVDWKALLRARSNTEPLLKRDGSRRYAAPNGPKQALLELARHDPGAVLSGSYVARLYRAVTAGGFLTVYTQQPDALADGLNLLPVTGPDFDVQLIEPKTSNPVRGALGPPGQWEAHLTQVVIDCLSGPGRMIDEGEALLDWMEDNPGWRQTPGQIGRWIDPWAESR